jgi:hypothetical protein
MFAEQLKVEHGISKGCRLVVEFDSVPTMLVIWEDKAWYPQASIFRRNFSMNIAGVNMYDLSENLSFPVTDV